MTRLCIVSGCATRWSLSYCFGKRMILTRVHRIKYSVTAECRVEHGNAGHDGEVDAPRIRAFSPF